MHIAQGMGDNYRQGKRNYVMSCRAFNGQTGLISVGTIILDYSVNGVRAIVVFPECFDPLQVSEGCRIGQRGVVGWSSGTLSIGHV